MTIFAQGDLLIERVADAEPGTPLPVDPDGAIVLGDGEPLDQGKTFAEVVARLRTHDPDYWDWPVEGSLVCWSHHRKAQPFKLKFVV